MKPEHEDIRSGFALSNDTPTKVRFALRLEGRSIPLTDGEFVLGRAASADIPLDDKLISRAHLRLMVHGERVEAEDCGSRNGSLVNGRRLESREPLVVGDLLTVGKFSLRLVEHRKARTAAVTRRVRPSRLDEGTAPVQLEMARLDDAKESLDRGDAQRAEESLGVAIRWLTESAPLRSPDDEAPVRRCLLLALQFGSATQNWEPLAKATDVATVFRLRADSELIAAITATSLPELPRTALSRLCQSWSETPGLRPEEVQHLKNIASPPAK